MADGNRPARLTLDLTLSPGADPDDVADAVLEYLTDSGPGEVAGVFSFDGCEVARR